MQRLGRVLKSNGTDGQLLVSFVGIDPEDIDLQEPVFILADGLPVPYFFDSFERRGVNRALVRLTGVRSLKDADELAGADLYAEDDLYEEEGEDLTGWVVINEDGARVGVVSAHEDIPGNPCIWVETPQGEVLLPLHEDLVLSVNEKSGTLQMRIPEGLLNL